LIDIANDATREHRDDRAPALAPHLKHPEHGPVPVATTRISVGKSRNE
jgi:hypothetical protein